MPEDEDIHGLAGLNDGEPLASEPRGFDVSQMVTCDVCLRANPPTRTACLYCTAPLPQSEDRAALLKPKLRPLEQWEQGFNNILRRRDVAPLNDTTRRGMADLLRLTTEDVARIWEAGVPLPVARAATHEDAQLIQRRLESLGVETIIVADQELVGDASTPQRVRTVELRDEALVVHPAGGRSAESIRWTDIQLFVTGRLIVRELEIAERRGKRKEGEIVDSRELSADEMLLDFYAGQGQAGWRIAAANFDFSCLGKQKALIAAQNFQTLLTGLRGRATSARYDDSYQRVRHALSPVWPLEQNTQAGGLRKVRLGRVVGTQAVTKSGNEAQFTRYSGLLHYLQRHQAEPDS